MGELIICTTELFLKPAGGGLYKKRILLYSGDILTEDTPEKVYE
jgi:hypothetical protein